MESKLTRAALHTVIYRWNGVKAFAGNGYYWMSNKTSAQVGFRDLPYYIMDLGTVIQTDSSGLSNRYTRPLLQMGQENATGSIAFTPKACVTNTGIVDGRSFVFDERSDVETAQPGNNVGERTMFQYAQIQANLWGAKNKATKYNLSIVKFTDDELVPVHSTVATYVEDLAVATPKRTDFYQHIIKPWTFNPIATTGGIAGKGYKVLQSHNIDISPNPTTDGDSDPQCRILKLFVKINKLMKYSDTAVALTTAADTLDQADYARNVGDQLTSSVKPKSRIYLIIRASNYGIDGTESNLLTPSFDLSVRTKHQYA